IHCTVSGRQGRRVVMAAPCDNTGYIRLKGKLDAAKATLSGKMVWTPPPHMHKHPKDGVFTLAKQRAGAGHARMLPGRSQGVRATFEVLLDDAANGFCTDPGSATGLSASAPAGGAQFASFVVPGPGGQGNVLTAQTFFTSPLVVAAGGSVTLDIVEDMIHTVFANVTGGVAWFDTSLPLPAVQLVPSVSGAGRVEFYSPT